MADRLRQFADETPRALRDLNKVCSGLRQLLGEGSRENRIGIGVVIGEPVERGLPRPRREHREHPFRQLRHRRKTAATGNRAGAGALERIVAAGIEHQNGGADLAVLQPLDDAVGEDRGVAHQFFLAFGRRRHIGWQQIVLPGDFKAVARIEKERGVAGFDRVIEGEQRLAELLPGLVFRDHDAKTELLQRIAHGAGVVDGLLQFRDVLVVVIADHQRNALFGVRGRGEHHQCRDQAPCDRTPGRRPDLHPNPPPCTIESPARLWHSRYGCAAGSAS